MVPFELCIKISSYNAFIGFIGLVVWVFVVSNVRNPGSLKLREVLLISNLSFVLQNSTSFSVKYAA